MPETPFAIVGLVRNAQGIRGEVVIEPITDAPGDIFAAGRQILLGDGSGVLGDGLQPRALTVSDARPFKGGIRVRFEEIDDRTSAELMRGRYLFARFGELTPPSDDEVYLHELVGMRVELDDGTVIGEVNAWYELPQGLTLEVRTATGTSLLPYRGEFIARVDEGKRVVVVKKESGIFD